MFAEVNGRVKSIGKNGYGKNGHTQQFLNIIQINKIKL